MELLFLSVLIYGFALGKLNHRTILVVLAHIGSHTCHCACTGTHDFIHAVGHGADGGHRCHHYVLHGTDVEVGICTHHRWVTAGADVVADNHRVRESLAALRIIHQHVNVGIPCVGDADRTRCSTDTLWRCHGACKGLQFRTSLKVHVDTGCCRQVHHVGVVERSALGERVRTVAARWVAQDVVEEGHTLGQNVLAGTQWEHVEHESLQRLCLVVSAVTQHGEGHRLQGILTRHHFWRVRAQRHRLVSEHGEDSLSQAVQFLWHLVGVALHAVLHVGNATVQTDEVWLILGIVVIQITLSHLQLDAVLALHAEHGIVESVERLCGVGRVLVRQRHFVLFAVQGAGHVVLVAEVVEVVVAHLLVGHLHW